MQKWILSLVILLFIPIPALAGDEVLINQMIKVSSGDVHLSPRTYIVDHPINLRSGVDLYGVPGKTVILLKPKVKWALWVPVIDGTLVSGCRISGITIDMNADSQTVGYGLGYHNGVFLKGCKNIEVDHCTFFDSKGDGIRCKTSSNLDIHDNKISKMGHYGIFVIDCKDVYVMNNKIETRTNSGVRDWNSVNVKISGNQITAQQDGKGGYAGIEIEYSKLFTNPSVMISGNTMTRTQGPGVQLIAYSQGSKIKKGITVMNNKFVQTGVSTYIQDTGGISILGMNGATISANVFDRCYNSGVLLMSGGAGTVISKNIFINIQPHVRDYKKTLWTGYAICNRARVKITQSGNTYSGLKNKYLF
jgi:polygalacturonase